LPRGRVGVVKPVLTDTYALVRAPSGNIGRHQEKELNPQSNHHDQGRKERETTMNSCAQEGGQSSPYSQRKGKKEFDGKRN